MRPIPITLPELYQNESEAIIALIDVGADIIHIRKGEHNRALLETLPQTVMKNLTVHYDKKLCEEFGLGGIHLPLDEYMVGRRVSSSCHSLDELGNDKDYYFLSPIFDSVSKEGYKAAFDTNSLYVYGLKCVALGGITKDNVSIAAKCGFDGVALIGSLWVVENGAINIKETVNNYKDIEQAWRESSFYYSL